MMLKNRIRELEDRIAALDRDDLLDELDWLCSAMDPADPLNLDMNSAELIIELNMLEDEIERDERIQELKEI